MWERLDEVALLFFFGPHTTHVLISIVHLTLGKNSCDMFEFSLTWSGNQGKIETPPNQPNRMAEFNFNSNILKEEEVRKREPKISFPMVHITAWMTYVWKTMFLKCGLRGQVVIKYDCKLIGVMRTFLTSESILVCVKDKQVFICI